MSDFLKVFGIQLKARFRPAGPKKGLARTIGLGAAIAVSIVSLIGLWTGMLYLYLGGLKAIGLLDLGLLMPFLAGMLVVLIFGVAGVLGILFQSKDISFLASLPVRQSSVFASKFFLVYLYELVILLLFVLPAIFVYGSIAGAGLFFYLKGIAAALLLPMLPLAISTLLSLILMRFTGLAKRREMLMVIAGFVLTIGYVIGQNMLMSRIAMMSQDEIYALLSQANGFVQTVGRSFPPALWAVSAVARTGLESLANWGLYLLSAFGAFAIAALVGSKLYLSGALAQLETAKRGKKARLDTRKITTGSPIRAMALREMKLIIRSPIYSLNSMIGVFLFPAMIYIVPMFSGSDPDLQAISGFIAGVPRSMIFIVCLGVGMLACMTNLASGTVMSREGEVFWLSKVIPVPYRTQAYGKLVFAWAIDAATILLCLVVAPILFPSYLPQIVPAAICALIGSVSITAISMIIDIMRPKLKWSSEAEAMKQNLNGMLGMLVSLILGAGFVLLAVLISLIASELLTVLATLFLVTAAALGSVALLGMVAESSYRRLEP